MSTPNQAHPVGSYVWTYPGCPLRILLSLELAERLRREALTNTAKDRELGGLLIGTKRSGLTRVFEFVPLPADPNAGEPHFTLAGKWLDEVIARCPSDSKVVGYYRSDVDQLIRLRPADLALMQERFGDPSSVCLVVAQGQGSGINAGFFCWHGDTLPVNPSLTFPLSVAELSSSGWPIQIQESFSERAGRIWSNVVAAVLRGGEAKAVGRISLLVTTAIVIAALLASRWAGSSASTPGGLGLQVSGDGTRFSVSWDKRARPVRNAADATLVIWDSSREDADGNTEPLHLPLTAATLRSGGITYTAFGPTDRVQFRLDIAEGSGTFRSESVTSVSPVQALKQENVPAPQPATAPRVAKAARKAPAAARFTPPSVNSPAARATPPPTQTFEAPRTLGRIIIPEPPPNLDAPERAISRTAPSQPSAFAATVDPSPKFEVPLTERPPAPAPTNNPPLRGAVTITSEPTGAEVLINAVPAGVTPVTLQISPVGLGFTVTVAKPGYLKWSLQTFATDKPYSLHAQLTGSGR